MEKRELAYEDYKKGLKYKEIADKYGVSVNTVKSWAARYWKGEKVATSDKKGCNLDKKKLQPSKKLRGGQSNNQNAVGNNGGAPEGNTNALKHGGYSLSYDSMLSEEQKQIVERLSFDEETMIKEQIKDLTRREFCLMNAIAQYRDMKGGLYVDEVSQMEHKKKFRNPEEEELYNQLRKQKIDEEKISYLYDEYVVATSTKSVIGVVERLESELTRVQGKKMECIKLLTQIRTVKTSSSDITAVSNNIESETVTIYLPDNGRN